MNDQDYIIHYGVLGMKWGHRKAAKYGRTYKFESSTTRHYKDRRDRLNVKASKAKSDKRRTKLQAKAKKANLRAVRSASLDRKAQKYASKTSTPKAVAQSLLFSDGGRGYAAMRASGVSRGKALARAALLGSDVNEALVVNKTLKGPKKKKTKKRK